MGVLFICSIVGYVTNCDDWRSHVMGIQVWRRKRIKEPVLVLGGVQGPHLEKQMTHWDSKIGKCKQLRLEKK